MLRPGLAFILLYFGLKKLIKSNMIENNYDNNLIIKLVLYFGIIQAVSSPIYGFLRLSDLILTIIIFVEFIMLIIIYILKMQKYEDGIKIMKELSKK